MNKTKIIIALLLLLIAFAFIGGILTHRAFVRAQDPPEPVIIEKKEYIPQPMPVKIEAAPDTIPSISIKKENIIQDADSSSVQVRPSVTTFADTLSSGVSYEIKASGIGTRIENIAFSWPQPQANPQKAIPYKGWSINAVGHGILTSFTPEGISGYAGVELGYTSNRFSFGIGPGCMWTRTPGLTSHKSSLAVMASIKIQLFRF